MNQCGFALIFMIMVAILSKSLASAKRQLSEKNTSLLLHPLLKMTGKLLRASPHDKNIVFSPVSIQMAMNMVLLGTDSASEVERELIAALGYAGMSTSQVNKSHVAYSNLIANFRDISQKRLDLLKRNKTAPLLDIFTMVVSNKKAKVLPEYKDEVQRYYGSSIVLLHDDKVKDSLAAELNKWAKLADMSRPMMERKELNERFDAILLTAINLQSYWFQNLKEFEDKKMFYNHGNSSEPVDGTVLEFSGYCKYLELTREDRMKYMGQNQYLKDQSSKLGDLNIQVIEVPLEGHLGLTIFEPLHGGELSKMMERLFSIDRTTRSNRLTKVLKLLDAQDESSIFDTVKIQSLRFPKFKLDNDLDLKHLFHKAGLRRIFKTPEIGRMLSSKILISDIKHQAMIDVNKYGVKAAAVTKVFGMTKSPMDDLEVKIENPFMFMIRYKKLPLFIGQLVELPRSP